MYTEEEVKRLAYLLWVDEGRPEGKDFEHYMKAKEILEERDRSLLPRTPESDYREDKHRSDQE